MSRNLLRKFAIVIIVCFEKYVKSFYKENVSVIAVKIICFGNLFHKHEQIVFLYRFEGSRS